MQPADPVALLATSTSFRSTLEIKSALKNQRMNINQSAEVSLSIEKRFRSARDHQ
jgi:hypothetical protein